MCTPCTSPFPNLHHPSSPHHSCPLPVVPAACPTWLYQPHIAPAYTQVQAQCRSLDDGDLAPAPHCILAFSRSAGSSHAHGSTTSRTTTLTSGANTNVRSMGMGNDLRPSNGPGRAGARRLTSAHGPSVRIHPIPLPLTLCVPNEPAPDLGFLRSSRDVRRSRNDGHYRHCSSSSSIRATSTEIASNTSSSSDLPRSARNKSSPPQAVSPPM